MPDTIPSQISTYTSVSSSELRYRYTCIVSDCCKILDLGVPCDCTWNLRVRYKSTISMPGKVHNRICQSIRGYRE